MREFLERLGVRQVPYVIFKNSHELATALAGDGDLDLFVPSDREVEFRVLALEERWVEAYNPIARFPGVSHFFGLDSLGRLCHLHVYFGLVTGESWIKEFLFPLDDWIIAQGIQSESMGVRVLDHKAQAYVFLLRHLLKNGSLTSRLLYSRDMESYRAEWRACAVDPREIADHGPWDLRAYLQTCGVSEGAVTLPAWNTARRCRRALSEYLRTPSWTLPLTRAGALIRRLVKLLGVDSRKRLQPHGVVIAIAGAEGAGKSTMVDYLTSYLGRDLRVESMHMGKPFGPIFRTALSIKATAHTASQRNSAPAAKCRDQTRSKVLGASYAECFAAVVLALLRMRAAIRCRRLARKGTLVITDRYPTTLARKMDGPRLRGDLASQPVKRFLAKLEQSIYEHIPEADSCIYLSVPVEIAIRRNQMRFKSLKETDEQVEQRHRENRDHAVKARRTIRLENALEFDKAKRQVLAHVWREIALSTVTKEMGLPQS
jgi:thymidylate kinase